MAGLWVGYGWLWLGYGWAMVGYGWAMVGLWLARVGLGFVLREEAVAHIWFILLPLIIQGINLLPVTTKIR